MSNHTGNKAILYALLANLGIAIIKSIAAFFTGSGSMLAEAIHSYADSGNQALLFVGIKKAKKEPTEKHPLGYGKEVYFYSFIVSLVLFILGGSFSIYEGVHKMGSTEPIAFPMVAVVVLVISIILESLSLMGCLREIRPFRNGKNLWEWSRDSRRSELVVVLGEDVAALIGLFVALLAVVVAMITGNPIYDALGSIFIGILLIIISFFLAVKIKGLLVGQSADLHKREEILKQLNEFKEIDFIFNLITFQLGEQLMIAVKAKMMKTNSDIELIENINACEARLRENNQDLKWIFFEPDLYD